VEKFINTDVYIQMPTKLQTACSRWLSVWKRRVAGKLIFKFQKPLGISEALFIMVLDIFNH
jgi:hypothetical protein